MSEAHARHELQQRVSAFAASGMPVEEAAARTVSGYVPDGGMDEDFHRLLPLALNEILDLARGHDRAVEDSLEAATAKLAYSELEERVEAEPTPEDWTFMVGRYLVLSEEGWGRPPSA